MRHSLLGHSPQKLDTPSHRSLPLREVRTQTGLFLILLSLSLVCVPRAFAAQNARVMIDTVEIRATPDEAANSLGQLKKDDVVRVSSKSKGGWFKVLVPGTQNSPQYGWVHADGLLPKDLADDQKAGHIQTGKTKYQEEELEQGTRTWSLSALAYVTSYNPHDIQGLAGFSSTVVSSVGPALELGLNPSEGMGFALHYHYFSTSASGTASQSYSLTTHFLDFIAELYPLSQEYMRLAIGIGITAAASSSSVNRLDPQGGPNIQGSQSWVSAGALFRLAYRQYLAYRFGLVVDGGYRYLNDRQIPLAKSTPALQLSGFFFEGGIFLEF